MSSQSQVILIADAVQQTRNLIAEVLRSVGFEHIVYAKDGRELLDLTLEHHPRIVITSSRLPELSGLEFTRLIRAGYQDVSRQLSIIVMTNTATVGFLEAARESGADELLVRPFTAHALLVRIQAVIERPREFVDSAVYIGPSRRRKMIEQYNGPMRRFVDPVGGAAGAALWESATNREAVRQCVKAISESAEGLNAGDRQKLQQIYAAVKDTETLADETRDAMMGAAARSLGRYINAIGAKGVPDPEVMTTHVDAMHSLGLLGSAQHQERQDLIEGLVRIVDKRLGRSKAA